MLAILLTCQINCIASYGVDMYSELGQQTWRYHLNKTVEAIFNLNNSVQAASL